MCSVRLCSFQRSVECEVDVVWLLAGRLAFGSIQNCVNFISVHCGVRVRFGPVWGSVLGLARLFVILFG